MSCVFFSAFSSRWDQGFWWNWDSCWGFWPLDSSLAASGNHVANAVFSTAVPTVKQQGNATSVESEKLSVSSLSTLRNFLETKFEYKSDLFFFFFINESPGVYVHRTANALNSVEFKWKYIKKIKINCTHCGTLLFLKSHLNCKTTQRNDLAPKNSVTCLPGILRLIGLNKRGKRR